MEWLLAPIDPSRTHEIGFYLAWHGRLMVLAWGILFPIGILIARFYKITPKQDWPHQLDSQTWWYSHLGLQIGGCVIMLIALYLTWQFTSSNTHSGYHYYIGYCVIALTIGQFFSGWLRGSKGGPTEPNADGSLCGDHYDMTLRRRIFEYIHKSIGYALIILACVTIITGLWQANAPRWMWLMLSLWWLFLLGAFVWLQRCGLALDTYQAIWGPDECHPGNKLKPIGWGIKRRQL